ncbi:muscarinic acetylcholine receptor M1-like [Ptychodera flava]|uniref:muscarinic acetylcholine receptor M1-like n=1 Tax=Ptychodera flava TaxID=63121 RepID=UPI003969D301
MVAYLLNTVWLLKGYWPFGEATCKFWLLVDYVTCLASVMGIILITLDRYLLMAFEMKYVLFQTPKRALLVILFSWVLAFFYAPAVLFGKYFAGESTIDHNVNCEIEGLDNFVYGVVTMCVEFFIPLLVISYLNCRVYLYIRKMAKRKIGTDITIGGVQQVSNETEVSGDVSLSVNLGQERKSVSTADPGSVTAGPSGHTNPAKHRKAAKTLSILVAVFICCWTPYNITVLVTTLCDACWNEVLWEVTNYLLWCNSTLNPFLYALTNQQFRRNFIFILTFGRVKRKIVPAF